MINVKKFKKKQQLKIKISVSIMVLIVMGVVTVTSIVANVLKDGSTNQAGIAVNGELEESKKLDLNSRLVKNLYNMVYDNRSEGVESFVYPNLDKIVIKDMDIESKMRLVISNLENKSFSYNDCSINGAININYNNKNYNCDIGNDGYIALDKVTDKYMELYGSLKDFDKNVLLLSSQDELYVYGVSVDNVEGYYRYKSSSSNNNSYSYNRKLVDAVLVDNVVSITENIVAIDLQGTTYQENVTYTFTLDDDGTYSYYSRVRNQL